MSRNDDQDNPYLKADRTLDLPPDPYGLDKSAPLRADPDDDPGITIIDPAQRQRSTLTRALIAICVMVLLALGLWLFGSGDSALPPEQTASAPAAPNEPTLVLPPLPPPSAPTTSAGSEPAPTAPDNGTVPAEPSTGVPPLPAPAPAEPPAQPEPAQPAVEEKPAPAKPKAEKAEKPAKAEKKPAAPAKPSPAPASKGGNYHLVLGDFGSLGNAQTLLKGVLAQKEDAAIQQRVTVGGYPDRTAAQAAQAKLAQTGHTGTLVVPAGHGFAVQLGVFSRASNVERLVQQLRAQGYNASSAARVTVGPYATRTAAEQALAKIRKKHAVSGQILTR